MADDNKMTNEELSAFLKREYDDARKYLDTELAPQRELATRYYKGEAPGLSGDDEDEAEQGYRSTIISTDLRDTVLAIMPDLMEVFFGSERVVEFVPRHEKQAVMADQATDYIDYLIKVENDGFIQLWQAFKNGLYNKFGVVKWWAEEVERFEAHELTGLTEDEFNLLLSESDTELENYHERMEWRQPDPVEPMPGAEPASTDPVEVKVYDVEVQRKVTERRIRFAAIPPEEFIFDKEARDVDTAAFVGHHQMVKVSDLVQMGYDMDEVLEYAGVASQPDGQDERQARNAQSDISASADVTAADPAMRLVPYYEMYPFVDFDGDGVAELRKVCAIGQGFHILKNKVVDERPFALFGPDPEPHTIVSSDIADRTMDIQSVNTGILRATLDSLAQAIRPRMEYVEGEVAVEDLLNNDNGAPIRVRRPGMLREVKTDFVGREGLAMLDFMAGIRENRTGQTKAAAGLNPDQLQSSTKEGVMRTLAASQKHINVIARVFAETGMKRLMRGMLRLSVRHQNEPKMVALRGAYIAVDPREWDPTMALEVRTGLGTGTKDQKLKALGFVHAKQEAILLRLGPENPLVDIAQYRHTLARMMELEGIHDTSRYFKFIDPNAPKQPQPPKPDPAAAANAAAQQQAQALVQAEMQKATINANVELQKAKMQDARERDKARVDAFLRAKEMHLKYGSQMVDSDMERALAPLMADLGSAQDDGIEGGPAAPAAPTMQPPMGAPR